MTRPSWPVLMLQIALGFSLLFLIVDFVQAWDADPVALGGFPWGSEDLTSGRWKYATKTRYLTSQAIGIWIYTVAFIIPFAVRQRWITFLLTGTVAIVGTVADETLAALLVP